MKPFRVAATLALTTLATLLPAQGALMSTGFEAPAFAFGSVDGQDGWTATGSYDQGITKNGNEYPGFDLQSWRISNAVTSGSFGDQTFSKPVANEAGESDAQSGGLSSGVRVRRFDAQWSFGSFTQVWQPGLSIDVSPDRGDGARMSLVTMQDRAGGMAVSFKEYRSGSSAAGCNDANFRTIDAATGLSRQQAHSIRLVTDFVEGVRNDVVRLYVNDVLKYTGTTWEDFFRECQGPGSRTVDSLLFRATGSACSSCSGGGFVIDSVQTRALGAVISGGPLSVTEGGASATYTVKLETAPLDTVHVRPVPGPQVTVNPSMLTFTPANFAVPQTVSVTAVDDSLAELSTTTLIGHVVTSATEGHFDQSPADAVVVTVGDNDGVFVLNETDGITVVAEACCFNDHYSFSLLSQPTATVTITPHPDSQVTVTPASRTFNPANWNVPQDFTVVAVDDTTIEGTHFGSITHTAASADATFDSQPVPTVTATIYDNDPSDTTPPVPPVITNCPGAAITTRSYVLAGTSEPATAIETYVNGAVYGSATTDGAGNWSSAVAFTANGMYSVTARAFDGSGNASAYSATCSITVNADFTAPRAPTITSPAQGSFTPATVTLAGMTFDDTELLRLYDGGVPIVEIAQTAGSWSFPRGFPTGLHTLTARAVDAAGNVSVPSSVRSFTADGDPPTVTNFSPPFTTLVQLGLPAGSYNVHGSAFDALSGVSRIDVDYLDLLTGADTVDTAACSGCPAAGGVTVTWSDPNPGLTPGFYRATIRAYDRVGNVGTTGTLLLFVA